MMSFSRALRCHWQFLFSWQFLSIYSCFVVLLLTSCATTEALPSYYVLAPPAPNRAVLPRSGIVQAFIQRVYVPSYLTRTSLASINQNQVVYSRTGRWASPLDQEIAQAVALNLQQRGINAQGFQPTVPPPNHADDVQIRVVQFEGFDNGEVVLAASWTISAKDSTSPFASQATRIVRTGWTPGDDAGLARVLSEEVTEMSARIAKTLH
jgi:uncharacterized lipoprotein YmbA